MNKLLENLENAELAIYDHVGFKGTSYPDIDYPIFDYSDYYWDCENDLVIFSLDINDLKDKDIRNSLFENYNNSDKLSKNNDENSFLTGPDLTLILVKDFQGDGDLCSIFDNEKRVLKND
jgi:hypothetical protein